MITLYQSCNNLIEESITGAADGSFITTATVVMTLKDATNTPVSGVNGLSLSYVSGSNCLFQGFIPASVSLTVGATYTLVITITIASTLVDTRNIPVQVQVRQEN